MALYKFCIVLYSIVDVKSGHRPMSEWRKPPGLPTTQINNGSLTVLENYRRSWASRVVATGLRCLYADEQGGLFTGTIHRASSRLTSFHKLLLVMRTKQEYIIMIKNTINSRQIYTKNTNRASHNTFAAASENSKCQF